MEKFLHVGYGRVRSPTDAKTIRPPETTSNACERPRTVQRFNDSTTLRIPLRVRTVGGTLRFNGQPAVSKPSKNKKVNQRQDGQRARQIVFFSFFFIIAVTIALGIRFATGNQSAKAATTNSPKEESAKSSETNLPTMEINTAVMVTEELDFGATIPSIADALKQIERHSEPDDHAGRTFAVLDAYGEPTADHKLHISMHVSAEKPGIAALIFRPTGRVLWKSKIIMGSKKEVTPLSKRSLLILVGNSSGTSFTIDGSNNPGSILDANVKEANVPLNVIWPDQTEREFTFVYSACGCPVKAIVRRVGDKTERVKELPVMFPDDPAALDVISRLMRWKS